MILFTVSGHAFEADEIDLLQTKTSEFIDRVINKNLGP